MESQEMRFPPYLKIQVLRKARFVWMPLHRPWRIFGQYLFLPYSVSLYSAVFGVSVQEVEFQYFKKPIVGWGFTGKIERGKEGLLFLCMLNWTENPNQSLARELSKSLQEKLGQGWIVKSLEAVNHDRSHQIDLEKA
jgi:hypothetical protein